MYTNSNEGEIKNLYIFDEIIEKSLFTSKQISIIYNKLHRAKMENKMSSGAYYRQVKQCKNKFYSLLYTILLFKTLKIIDDKTFLIIESIVDQLDSLLKGGRNHTDDPIPQDVINVIDKIIKKSLPI